MDEMHVKEDLVYNKHSGGLIGFMNLGDMNNHFINLQQAAEDGQSGKIRPLATGGNGQRAVFLSPICTVCFINLTGDLMFDVFLEVVERLER